MDNFDYQDQPRPTRNIGALIWNILTVLVLLAAVCVAGVFLAIFTNPNSSLNIFPPSTLPVALEFPTVTPTPRGFLPSTWTPQPTAEPTQTNTPRPTATLPATETPFSLFTAPAVSPSPSVTPGGMAYAVSSGSPSALSSQTLLPNAGCNWMGVGGQVFNLSGAPVTTGVVVQLGGVVGGQVKDVTSLTGTAPQYGPSGYEIVLGEQPVASNNTLWIQLLDIAGEPMSDKVFFETFEDCQKNLVIINFTQAR